MYKNTVVMLDLRPTYYLIIVNIYIFINIQMEKCTNLVETIKYS